MSKEKNKYGKYKCHCCGYYTLRESRDNSFEICPVCGWEDDAVQSSDPLYRGGANDESLQEARANYIQICAINNHMRTYSRAPEKEEMEN
jgi:tRNA G26 N,N-dimethylase Trm1